jgi:hypothetical protein
MAAFRNSGHPGSLRCLLGVANANGHFIFHLRFALFASPSCKWHVAQRAQREAKASRGVSASGASKAQSLAFYFYWQSNKLLIQ